MIETESSSIYLPDLGRKVHDIESRSEVLVFLREIHQLLIDSLDQLKSKSG